METQPPLPKTMWDKLATYLREAGSALSPRPKAILAISGHWETARPTILTSTQHHLYFDYYNFPPHTYELRYAAKGSPWMTARMRELLTEAGIGFDENHERGLDHGVFVPFMLMFPEAALVHE
jgi:aromatic ring-opening dioxygenase catalytic subunit (LigB family)